MFDLPTLGTFIAVVLGLFLIPGPAVLLVVSRTLQGGRKTGVLTGLGIAAGDFGHTLFASVGLSAVLMTSALAFNAVKYVGAAYLIYLGIRAFLARPGSPSLPAVAPIAPAKAFLQAIAAELLNPKTALFFLAFMPQFVHPEHGSAVAQFATLGLIFVAMSAAYTSLLALAAGQISPWIRRHRRIGQWQGRVVGTIYIALGIRLAFQER